MLKDSGAVLLGASFIAAAIAAPAAAQDVTAKVQICASCHGENGTPIDSKTIPVIWGQQVSYIVKQLHDYRSGDRQNPIMTPIAKTIAIEDMRPIANYFAAKAWPAGQPAASTAAAPAGIAQCRLCHQPNFEGGPPAPRLAGLSYEYLIGAMNAFAADKRTNNLDMPGFMRALSESDREAMAHYIAGL
jgi:cytochrome c553